MSTWRLVAGWLVVLAVTTALTWQIVSFADNQVSARPVAVAPSASSAVGGSSTSTSISVSSTSSTSSPTTTIPGDSTTSSSSASSSSSTSMPATTSTSTETWGVRSIVSAGGTVIVRYRPNEVELQAATPSPGFEMEIDDDGPERVRVEFENDDTGIRVEVRWESDGLDIEISEND